MYVNIKMILDWNLSGTSLLARFITGKIMWWYWGTVNRLIWKASLQECNKLIVDHIFIINSMFDECLFSKIYMALFSVLKRMLLWSKLNNKFQYHCCIPASKKVFAYFDLAFKISCQSTHYNDVNFRYWIDRNESCQILLTSRNKLPVCIL